MIPGDSGRHSWHSKDSLGISWVSKGVGWFRKSRWFSKVCQDVSRVIWGPWREIKGFETISGDLKGFQEASMCVRGSPRISWGLKRFHCVLGLLKGSQERFRKSLGASRGLREFEGFSESLNQGLHEVSWRF